jgi:excisionase family DNA binding protein
MSKTKAEAAEFLGVGIRAVERYSEQGRLTVRYEKGKTRPVAMYDDKELQTLKEELKANIDPPMRPQVMKSANPEQGASGVNGIAATQQQSLALISSIPTATRAVKELADLFKLFENTRQPTIIDLANKPLLKLDEAQTLTGLSRQTLREAIKGGKLKAKMIGRAYRIKQTDIQEFIKKL